MKEGSYKSSEEKNEVRKGNNDNVDVVIGGQEIKFKQLEERKPANRKGIVLP
jgi:hypothetical protein